MSDIDRKIIMYATTEGGDGRVQQIGIYEALEDIEVIIRMFAPEVVISLEWENEKVL